MRASGVWVGLWALAVVGAGCGDDVCLGGTCPNGGDTGDGGPADGGTAVAFGPDFGACTNLVFPVVPGGWNAALLEPPATPLEVRRVSYVLEGGEPDCDVTVPHRVIVAARAGSEPPRELSPLPSREVRVTDADPPLVTTVDVPIEPVLLSSGERLLVAVESAGQEGSPSLCMQICEVGAAAAARSFQTRRPPAEPYSWTTLRDAFGFDEGLHITAWGVPLP